MRNRKRTTWSRSTEAQCAHHCFQARDSAISTEWIYRLDARFRATTKPRAIKGMPQFARGLNLEMRIRNTLHQPVRFARQIISKYSQYSRFRNFATLL